MRQIVAHRKKNFSACSNGQMKKAPLLSLGLIGLAVLAIGRLGQAQGPASTEDQEPRFTSDGQLLNPRNYRDWVFLSSGLGMTYGPLSGAAATA
jgi:hypothetical protein